MKSFLHSLFQYAGKRDKLRASLPAQTVIQGQSADNREALLNSRCPLSEWKSCIGFPRADKLADSRILCRMRAEQAVSVRSGLKYQSAGRERTGTCRTVISSEAKRSREISQHRVPPLQWPQSIESNAGSFPRMELGEALRNTDTQISTLFYRLTSPVSLSLPPQTSNLKPLLPIYHLSSIVYRLPSPPFNFR